MDVGCVYDKVGIEVIGGDEDGLSIHAIKLEIGLVERGKVGARLELFEGEGALNADLLMILEMIWRRGRRRRHTHTCTPKEGREGSIGVRRRRSAFITLWARRGAVS